jgi:hypothetical protein
VELSLTAEQGIAQRVVEAIRARLAAVPARPEVRFADLEEAVEGALRDVGGRCLEVVVAEVGTGYRGAHPPCGCGARQETDHYVSATWQTVLGDVRVRRAAYRCPSCGVQAIPLDDQLGLPTDRTSPLLRARLSRFCAVAPFAEACTLLEEASGVRVSAKRAQLVSEELGAWLEAHQAVPPASEDGREEGGTPRRVYVGMDGVFYCTTERDAQQALLWREAKVGVIAFPLPAGAPGTGRHSHLAPDGRPIDVLDPERVSYVVHMGDGRGFADKLWREAERRGIERVTEIVLLSDGAEWIETVRTLLFDGLGVRVVHILDLRHAEEHLWEVARLCLGEGAAGWIEGPREDLREGRVDALLAALRQLPTPTADAAKLVATTCTYFDERRAMLDYPRFRREGYQIGSGIAESACKRLVSQREKGPGMHWTTPGAQAIATLRAAHLSNRWDEAIEVARAA